MSRCANYVGLRKSVAPIVNQNRSSNEAKMIPKSIVSATNVKRFDDLTDTVFAGHHQPLKVWMLCLYFMGLNLSNAQIAKELDLNKDDMQKMVSQLRLDVFKKSPVFWLKDEEFCQKYKRTMWLSS